MVLNDDRLPLDRHIEPLTLYGHDRVIKTFSAMSVNETASQNAECLEEVYVMD